MGRMRMNDGGWTDVDATTRVRAVAAESVAELTGRQSPEILCVRRTEVGDHVLGSVSRPQVGARVFPTRHEAETAGDLTIARRFMRRGAALVADSGLDASIWTFDEFCGCFARLDATARIAMEIADDVPTGRWISHAETWSSPALRDPRAAEAALGGRSETSDDHASCEPVALHDGMGMIAKALRLLGGAAEPADDAAPTTA